MLGRMPASESLLALTMTMQRIGVSPFLFSIGVGVHDGFAGCSRLSISNVEPGTVGSTWLSIFFCGLHFRLRTFHRERKVHSMHRREWMWIAGNFLVGVRLMSLIISGNAGFWSRFEERVAPFNLLQHPFYQAWSKGELTREDLREYAAEYWHHVSAFPTYLSALHSRLPDGEMRREVLRNLVEEEGVDAATARPHSDLWMDFAMGMGASREEVVGRAVQPETTALVADVSRVDAGGEGFVGDGGAVCV